jgi:AcrR family transcriptional regulator
LMPARARRAGSAVAAGGSGVAGGGGGVGRVARRGSSASARGVRGVRIAAFQRSRLLAAAACAIDELGYPETSVEQITSRARVSRRTFYELFANREECLIAVLEDALAAIAVELRAVDLGGLVWRERVREGLWVILSFFDREPLLARVCVVGALSGGAGVLERREEVLRGLAGVVDGGRFESARGGECSALTAEGLLGAVFAIVYTRLLRGQRGRLGGLLGELMGMIVLPYLGPAAARREQARPFPARLPCAAGDPAGSPVGSVRSGGDSLEGVPMRLTYRTVRVLEGVAEDPGSSNRQVADRAGIQDAGQVSKLLRRLERLGLLCNQGAGHEKGEPNAWRLTGEGECLAQSIRVHSRHVSEAAR